MDFNSKNRPQEASVADEAALPFLAKGKEQEDSEALSKVILWLGCEVWLSAMSWCVPMYYLSCFFWHVLDPSSLGADMYSILVWLLVLVLGPLVLEVPKLREAMAKHHVQSSAACAAAIFLLLFVVEATLDSASDHFRSTCLAVALLCVELRVVAIAGSPFSPQRLAERSLAPWGLSLGLLLVLIVRWGHDSLNPWFHVPVAQILFLALSLLAVLLKVWSACSGKEPGHLLEVYKEPEKQCQQICEPLAQGTSLAMLTFLTLWLLSATCVVTRFNGVSDERFGWVVLLAFAAGVGQSLALPHREAVVIGALSAEVALGGCMLCVHGFVGFWGGCSLALAVPGLWMVALRQVSEGMQHGQWMGRALSACGVISLVMLMAYLGVVMGSGPLAGFHNMFSLFTLLLLVSLGFALIVVHLFYGSASSNAHVGAASGEVRLAILAWLGAMFLLTLVQPEFTALLTRPPVSPQAEWRGLVVGSYNIEQGYRTDGRFNLDCVREILQEEQPHVVGLQESDATHVFSHNNDIVGFLARRLNVHSFAAPDGWQASVGVALLSQYELHGASTQKMPQAGPLNRFLTRGTVTVNGTIVTIFSVHTEWFGDPSQQIRFIAQQLNATSGPLVLVGDFNLDPSGQNDATIAAGIDTTNNNSLALLLAVPGVQSATPIEVAGCTTMVAGPGNTSYCKSDFTTVDIGEDSPGYQLDYIFYRGLELSDVHVGSHSGGICSDHKPIFATFALPNF